MKKSTILATAALTAFGAALIAPAAVADPRINLPFVPVSVPLDPPQGDDWGTPSTT
ncbi:hypothetical protein [Mycolicibacterium sp.]|uniref:hypothetical protein n=1 Tax=Mycolicibacterium sp. TaxID=2320850 RepID=UPI001A186691|nr:hypothetical protein [Mycolicibacterium sp.]MBJ7340118.1 hypothetical protein [Mycolicibacterium sp.]